MTRFVLISDTHNHRPSLPVGDILIHAGDLTMSGRRAETEAALEYLGVLAHRFRQVVFVGGNHDWFLYHLSKEVGPNAVRKFVKPYGENILYLENEIGSILGDDGMPITLYGSPVQPEFGGWAWNQSRGDDIRETWDRIPSYHPLLSIDVLITHGPPYDILDWIGRERVGCKDLRDAIVRVRPKLHVFGHIHCAYGKGKLYGADGRDTDCYNAALCGEAQGGDSYPLDPKHKPWVLDYDGEKFTQVPEEQQ